MFKWVRFRVRFLQGKGHTLAKLLVRVRKGLEDGHAEKSGKSSRQELLAAIKYQRQRRVKCQHTSKSWRPVRPSIGKHLDTL